MSLLTDLRRPLPLVALCLGLAACDKPGQDKPAAPQAKAEPAAPAAATTPPAAEAKPATPPAPALSADLGDFGSDEPIARADEPTRGVLSFKGDTGKYANMDHWEEYNFPFEAKRWGHYQVRLKYRLNHATLGVQFKFGETRLRKSLSAAGASKPSVLGEIFIAEAGPQVFSLYTPNTGITAGFKIDEVTLVPTYEGEPSIAPAADGSLTLLAKDATTWSERMRYEPKPEKNCLGFWTEPDDIAEWEFTVAKPGRYQVLISHGCGNGNGGSEVEVKVGAQALKFKVEDSGGFQNWRELSIGEIEIKQPGTQRLVVDPVTKAKSAVLDVQKITLKPLS